MKKFLITIVALTMLTCCACGQNSSSASDGNSTTSVGNGVSAVTSAEGGEDSSNGDLNLPYVPVQ